VFVSLTRVNTADQPIGNASIVAEEMTSWLHDVEGFEGLLMLSREGTTLGLAFWESREVAERHRVSRLQFRDRMTSIAGVEIEEVLDYEVTFADLSARATRAVARGADVDRAEPVTERHRGSRPLAHGPRFSPRPEPRAPGDRRGRSPRRGDRHAATASRA
jgi:hypothetical protein